MTQRRPVATCRRHGLTVAQYNSMLRDQDFACAICLQQPVPGTPLCIDHDHSCCPGIKSCGGCVRGLLCTRCNTGIGMLGDDLARLEAAADYLREFA